MRAKQALEAIDSQSTSKPPTALSKSSAASRWSTVQQALAADTTPAAYGAPTMAATVASGTHIASTPARSRPHTTTKSESMMSSARPRVNCAGGARTRGFEVEVAAGASASSRGRRRKWQRARARRPSPVRVRRRSDISLIWVFGSRPCYARSPDLRSFGSI